ncbi:hypothetical protein Patl1_03748 [Pistacia atlantica]|uniref:Uncharacterized protein n=1 Tax=Pistacia atlantica TaxID=434234 RepID=A0ACC1BV88_9ROSI|nr:hypothetical protein Patl1_03748 [Pistacia atlantica]
MGICNSIPQPADDTILAALSSCIGYLSRQLNYKRELKTNLDALRTELEILNDARNDVLRRVKNEEQRPQRERLRKVEGWLTRVEKAVSNVDKLITDSSEEVERLCLGGCCYNNYYFASSRCGRRVDEKLQVVRQLKDEGKEFKEVADQRLDDPVDNQINSEPPQGLESTFDEIWKCHEGDQVRIIGLYGKVGVGKTALLKQIYNKIRQTSADIDPIWISATNKNLQSIQDEIGKYLLLNDESWENKSFMAKSMDIQRILKTKKFVLLLDDIWEWVDLIEAGVPLSDTNAASKVFFTTRLLIKVCGRMKPHMIPVKCLEHDFALKLFRSTVGCWALDSHPEIPALAETMVKECEGLPLAIIQVAKSMTHKKTPEEWDYAIHTFRRMGHEFSGMQEVFRVLRSSYDKLEDQTEKQCFLCCCLFPKNYMILKRGLIDYWISEGFLDGKHVARDKGCKIMGNLIHGGLLEEEDDERVKLLGVFRDLAMWITENDRGKEKFSVATGAGLTEAPEAEAWDGVTKMSLMENQIQSLPDTPSSHCLETLFLNGNNLKVINSSFFQFMRRLTVLNLSNNPSLTILPPEIAKLLSLQHLDLSSTGVKEFPKELKTLLYLRYLNLENTSQLQTMPQQLLSKFQKLETLRMWKCGALDQDGEVLIKDLLLLGRLKGLDISIRGSPALERLLSSRRLVSCLESLSLQNLIHTRSIPVFLADLKKLERLHISDCEYLEELQINCEDGENSEICVERLIKYFGFRSLREVEIMSCPALKHLTWLILATSLKRIVISECPDMEELISVGRLGEFPESVRGRIPFERIQSIVLRRLPNLHRINQTALLFPNLKEIEVIGCPQLKRLPLESECAKKGGIVIKGERQWWDGLQWEDPTIRASFEPYFIEERVPEPIPPKVAVGRAVSCAKQATKTQCPAYVPSWLQPLYYFLKSPRASAVVSEADVYSDQEGLDSNACDWR